MSQTKDVPVPDIGDFDEVEVIEVLVSAGDTIAAEDSLITLESDKASMEIPAPFGGTVKDVKIKVGDKVAEGSIICTVETADEDDSGEGGGAAQESADTEKVQEPPKEKEQAGDEKPSSDGGGGGTRDVPVPDIGAFDEVEGIEVLVLEKNRRLGRETPDAVFPNNWFSTEHDGTLIFYPMLAENRRAEIVIMPQRA